jgi:hypothetical protein
MTKQFDNLRARCALAGVTLHSGTDNLGNAVFMVSRWNMSRTFATLEQVKNWLEMVTGVQSGANHER